MKKWIIISILLIIYAQSSVATIYHAEGEGNTRFNDVYSQIGTLYNGDYYTYYFHSEISHATCVWFTTWIYNHNASVAGTYYLVDESSCCWSYPPCCFSSRSGSFSSHWESSMKEPVTYLYIDGTQGSSSCNYYEYSFSQTLITSTNNYHVSGIIGCVDNIDLYVNDSGSWINLASDDVSGETSYSYNISEGYEYKIVLDDYEYIFTCTGDETVDYETCTYIYGYTCNINWVKLWRDNAGTWTYVDMESQPNHGLNTYMMQIVSGYSYKVNFSDGHEHEFTCSGSNIEYDWDRCVWAYPPSPWQPPEIIPWYLGYDNNIVFMRDSHGNFIENAQVAVYNKNTGNYTQKWTNTPDPYILLAANNDSNDDVIVMCRTFDGVFTLETVDPAFGTDENVTWTNWTIPIMYNLEIHPIDQSNMPLHHVFVSMYEYTPFDPLAFFGYDTYWGCIPVTNCSGFSRCDIVAEKEGYRDYNVTGLNWTTKNALVKDYKQDIVLVRES